jgi:hypothetical protein
MRKHSAITHKAPTNTRPNIESNTQFDHGYNFSNQPLLPKSGQSTPQICLR